MSIRKRGNIYQVCYRVPGERSPRTESFKTEDEALIRDAQIRLAKKNGTFKAPARLQKGVIEEKKEITVRDFLKEYFDLVVAQINGRPYEHRKVLDNAGFSSVSNPVWCCAVMDCPEGFSGVQFAAD